MVLLDMRMPVMNGLEVLQELRRREVRMPVVMRLPPVATRTMS